ncbi:4-deoxy-L-erythro-5-hexoseulose uronic acid reductase [Balamuthia mandrillaris]
MQQAESGVKLQYKPLGNTGLMVSELCLGAMTFATTEKGVWGMPASNEEQSHAILDRFVAAGGNFIDTADVYGESEEVLGRWLVKQRRESLVIATKVRGRNGPTVNDVGLSRKHIFDSVERSLKALQTDYIDLYQVHSWDISTPLKETLTALNDLVRSGKVRYVGISNYSGWQLQKAKDICKHLDYAPIVSLQIQYSLLCRWTEWELLPVCKNEGVGVLPWSPLKGGWLTGKFKRSEKSVKEEATGSRVGWAQNVGWEQTNVDSLDNEHTWKVLEVLKQIAESKGKSQAQVALRWLLQKPTVTCPIIGARTLAHLEDNLGAVGWSLTEEEMKQLDEASAIEVPYPWGMYWNTARDRY